MRVVVQQMWDGVKMKAATPDSRLKFKPGDHTITLVSRGKTNVYFSLTADAIKPTCDDTLWRNHQGTPRTSFGVSSIQRISGLFDVDCGTRTPADIFSRSGQPVVE